MEDNIPLISDSLIENSILTLRGIQVVIDKDIATLYGVETKYLNQAVKRNADRFPLSFRFQISEAEFEELVTNCDRFKPLKHSSSRPYAFTEQGVAMLSAVLHSPSAIQISVKIIDVFVRLRHFVTENADVFRRLDRLEIKQLESDMKINQVMSLMEKQAVIPNQGIFYDGQIFDAYLFVYKLIKGATKEIMLIDNYIDETVLTLLDKRESEVSATIYTKTIDRQLRLDLQRHNEQYSPIDVRLFGKAHDRFLIIDDNVYHIGASLKDLGKKWFAFSLMRDLDPQELIQKISADPQ
ncbi:MAG: ORF6N domain-containing protein [Bacteroidales bacterium]|nr:ORF6N domain-containing protein [Bacteroidales bacterium]